MTPEHAYLAGFGSVAVSFASWLLSRAKPDDSKAQSDRWGIFVGQWAPTFFAIGVALKLEENLGHKTQDAVEAVKDKVSK
ncbi:hypothetical protein ODZ83_10905 [Acaricomes phytoseiuli]|uniref:hypothetical protein n=1 Tax=Acaricomes phytoseiuli TaxID=291968 RepID=UPI001FE04287|nr:hypothetical protein [Acaricomes phytoseiuli]MCW1250670.1 hypothetical protein [Acaricomes phytoseiuli]